MSMIPLTHRNTTGQPGGSTLLDRILDDLIKTFDSIAQLITNDALVTTFLGPVDSKICHGLGHLPKSWEIVDITANATVWRISWDDQFITLHASGMCQVTIRFT